MPTDERVLVVPTAHARAVVPARGFTPADRDAVRTLLDPRQFTFRPRREVESDPAFQQLIPYLVFRCGDVLFHYRRGAAGTETRLTALRSVGVGGHISEDDAAGGDPYRAGIERELAEEVELAADFTERLVGFVADDSTQVGTVHLGVVHLFDLSDPLVTAKDPALAAAGFAPLAELHAASEEFETWSRFVLDWLVTSSPPVPGRSPV